MPRAEKPATVKLMRRAPLVLALVLAGLMAYLAPALPALARFGALPRAPERPVTVLLAGVTPKYAGYHTRAPEDYGGLTDTLMVAQFRPGEDVLRLLNIPRDTWLNVPGWGWGKINGANVHGGPQLLVGAVEQVTGLRLDGYALVNLQALRDVVDAAGGVTLTVPEVMRYSDTAAGLNIDLKPGRQRLTGEQAEGFMRFRHDGLGDIGRVGRQQAFMAALSGRLASPLGVLRLPAVLGAAERNTRSSLTREDAAHLFYALLQRPKLSTTLLPGSFGAGGTWTPDRAAMQRLAQGDFASGDPRDLSVALVNVDAPDGSARRLKARLEGLGYRNVWIAPGARHAATTVIHASGPAGAARELQRDVGFGRVLTGDDAEVSGADLTVRLGSDTPAP